MADLQSALMVALANTRITATCESHNVEPDFTYAWDAKARKARRVFTIATTGLPMPDRVLSIGGRDRPVMGGDPPRMRDASRVFKDGPYRPVSIDALQANLRGFYDPRKA